MVGAIADHELMFEQERVSYDLAPSARAEQFREGHEQMDRQEEQIAHEFETILPANLHKTAPRRRFMPNLPIRHPQGPAIRCAVLPSAGIVVKKNPRCIYHMALCLAPCHGVLAQLLSRFATVHVGF
jgi:hypothetical protein